MYKPLNEREPFNTDMDVELLKNGFCYYNDWEHGPMCGWSGSDSYNLKLFRHNFGYWLILSRHASGANEFMNIGSSNDAKEIISVRDALQKLW